MKVKYIVSGLPRSGTSLMMKLFQVSGVPLFYDEELEKKLLARNTKDNIINDYFFEVKVKPADRFIIGENLPENHAIKLPPVMTCFLSALDKDVRYQIVFMVRDKEAIKNSYISAFGGRSAERRFHKANWDSQYENLIERIPAVIKQRKDFSVTMINFNALIDNPEKVLNQLIKAKIPMDKNTIIDQEIIDPLKRRF